MLQNFPVKDIFKRFRKGMKVKSIVRQFEGLERSSFLGVGCLLAYFQEERKVDVDGQKRKSLTM